MKFDVSNYGINHVMHCATKDEAIIFTEYLHSIGLVWLSGSSYYKNHQWRPTGGGLCYRFKKGTCGEFDYYDEDGTFAILEFRDFEWDKLDALVFEIDYNQIMGFGG